MHSGAEDNWIVIETNAGWSESWVLPKFIQEDTKRLRELTPKLAETEEAANEAEHNVKRGELPKW